MKRVDSEGNLNGKFTNGDPINGIEPTVLESTWLNAVQEEICTVIEKAGLIIDIKSNSQLLEAVEILIRQGEFKKIIEMTSTLIISNISEPTIIIESDIETTRKFLEFNYRFNYQNFQAQSINILLMVDGKTLDKKTNIVINANDSNEYRFKETFKLSKESGKYKVTLMIQPTAGKINISDGYLIIKEV